MKLGKLKALLEPYNDEAEVAIEIRGDLPEGDEVDGSILVIEDERSIMLDGMTGYVYIIGDCQDE